MVSRIDAEIARRAAAGFDEEDQLVVIVTDGMENASREHTRKSVFSLISDRRDQGWTFLFLGADQDSYDAGGSIGMARASTADWDKSAAGANKMWKDVAYSTEEYRRRSQEKRRSRSDDVFLEDPDGSSS